MLKIAIDAMGGDNGCQPIVEGVIAALKKDRHFIAVLVGAKDKLLPLIPQKFNKRIVIHEASDVIAMSDSATDALKRKDSSAYKAIYLSTIDHLPKLLQLLDNFPIFFFF